MLARRRSKPKPLSLRLQNGTCKRLSIDIRHEPRHHAIAKWASGLIGNAVVPCVVEHALRTLYGAFLPAKSPGSGRRCNDVMLLRGGDKSPTKKPRYCLNCSRPGPFLVYPTQFASKQTRRRLGRITKPFKKMSLPAPRTSTGTMIPCPALTSRTASDLGTIAGRLDKRDRRNQMLSTESLSGLMGFPKDWLALKKKRWPNKQTPGRSSPARVRGP